MFVMELVMGSGRTYKLAAIDLDDTLLGPDKQVSSHNLQALSLLRQHGIMPVLASGRRHENMARFHRHLELKGYIISAQGALAKHAENGTIVYQADVAPDLAAEIVREGLARELAVIVYHQRAVYGQGRAHHLNEYTRLAGDPVEACDLRGLAGQSFEKVLWIEEEGTIAKLWPAMKERYAGRADTVVTEPTFLEFTATGVSKASALAALAAHLGIERQEVLAFGDGNNDATMLAWAGMGVAMSHGKESAKAAARAVAPEGDPETSFARAVERALGAGK